MQKILLASTALLAFSISFSTQSAMSYSLSCTLKASNDRFVYFPEQLIYQSDQFAVFHNFKGRVVTQVDLKTDQMIRTTYIGEPFDPEYQILFGSCANANTTLSLWLTEQQLDNPTL
ncbi:hypothetical protein GT360_09005 [Vibrio astriarenae]|uniref:Uncharacterized protein n=1 Tax=Vibrio astriarenae TaxID=1481923 RepID=A0A7Z2T3F2_9VIBR|nr:hypothetical protein [Vibrio astriarenae]QIA63644.1 hypothetical protein GT360_09005 [Vibrio astriarenae]